MLPDFVCRQPIQCRLEEHLCYTPCVPLPSVSQDGDFGESAFQHLYMNDCEGVTVRDSHCFRSEDTTDIYSHHRKRMNSRTPPERQNIDMNFFAQAMPPRITGTHARPLML